LNNKADPNICYEGVTPLYTASRHGHTEIVELLLNNKADLNICYEGLSPLYIASLHGHTENVKLLLNEKADPNICSEGVPPLHAAYIRVSFIIQQQFDNLCMTVVRSGV
jgi:serine/threonine-protein phosphatase 6 regulatory ankyrin repeat subunit B